MIKKALLQKIIGECLLDDVYEDLHGISHWTHVATLGKYLSKQIGDNVVTTLFAYLHDCKRLPNGNGNWEHGQRAGKFAQELFLNGLLSISESQLDQLIFACQHHNNHLIDTDDVTIQACWDADRLDLWRIGAIPDINFLHTDIAKKQETIDFARKLNGY